jgi:hypothetical protein
MQIFFFGGLIPTDKGIAGFHGPSGRSPAQAGHRSLVHEGHIFEMTADDLTVTEIMILVNETVIERFQGGIPDQG